MNDEPPKGTVKILRCIRLRDGFAGKPACLVEALEQGGCPPYWAVLMLDYSSIQKQGFCPSPQSPYRCSQGDQQCPSSLQASTPLLR